MEVDVDEAKIRSIARVGGGNGDPTTPNLYRGSHVHEDPDN